MAMIQRTMIYSYKKNLRGETKPDIQLHGFDKYYYHKHGVIIVSEDC